MPSQRLHLRPSPGVPDPDERRAQPSPGVPSSDTGSNLAAVSANVSGLGEALALSEGHTWTPRLEVPHIQLAWSLPGVCDRPAGDKPLPILAESNRGHWSPVAGQCEQFL